MSGQRGAGTPFARTPTHHRDDITWRTILGIAAGLVAVAAAGAAITLALLALAAAVRP